MHRVPLGLLLATACWIPLPARAEDGGEAVFEGAIAGRKIATETSRIESADGNVTLTVQGRWQLPSGEVSIQSVTRYQGTPLAPEGMSFKAGTPGGIQTNEVTFSTGKVAFRVGGASGSLDRSADLALPPLLLDNLVLGHYRLIPRMADLASVEKQSYSLVVPQALAALPATLHPTGAVQVIGPSGPATADSFELEVAGQVSTLYFTREGREFVGSAVPLQRFVMVRSGWTLPESGSVRPAYVDTAKFQSHQLSVVCGPYTLPGTLCVPVGGGPFPVVVLVHGSGPHDQDETIGPTKPFRDLAEGLATAGIASYRYQKRTQAYGEELARIQTSIGLEEEVFEDALAAIALVRGRMQIDPARVFVLGHSLGGLLAPEIAARDGKLAGAILLAAPARPMGEVVTEQLQYLSGLAASPAIKEATETLLRRFAQVQDGSLGDDAGFMGATAKYWRVLLRYDIRAALKKAGAPVLALQGARDYQVRPADLAVIAATLAEIGGTASGTRTYPALNHLFIAGEGKSTPAEYGRAGHVDAQVIADIASFIRERK